MIVLTRREARRLRAVLRRRTLGLARNGPAPPVTLQAAPTGGLLVRLHFDHLAVECLLEGDGRADGSVMIPMEALADFEGRDESPVTLESPSPGRSTAHWDDRGVPQSREYAVPDVAKQAFPEVPADLVERPPGLLEALSEAAQTAGERSARHALDCILLRGSTSEVIATDGRQVLVQGGFGLPWDDDLLVRAVPLFASKALPRDAPVAIGRTGSHVVLRAGAWTLHPAIQADARFPHVEHAVPDPGSASTRLAIDPGDAAFLAAAIDRLPGGDDPHAPATLDCNGRVAVRARASGGGPTTELVLARSRCAGEPVRLHTNREYLARALRLGFDEVRLFGPDAPALCRDGLRSFAWQPLSKESAIGPSDDAVVVEPAGADRTEKRRSAPLTCEPAPAPVPEPAPEGSAGVASALQEAEALHRALADARSRTGRLIAALRRDRRRSRLVASTLRSIKEPRLHEIAGGSPGSTDQLIHRF
ncbi:hypothetical protein [Paludisphaera mucosa]|uniref:Uncharacterized protein n=1 Tax=Paludisphaera mucosa TaxID=3030827 RepID=A0ABT6FEX7_9BACT|nr:hypothetical protein [Paludisphaera mucosa]MDG3005935.1 hypothetical protein [Paludisphaera mucosa]